MKQLILCSLVFLTSCSSGHAPQEKALTDFTACGYDLETVLTGANGDKSASLIWEQPLLLEDGRTLVQDEIDSFYINWKEETGLSSGEYIVEGYIEGFIVDGLKAGNYEFTICSKTVYGPVSQAFTISRSL
jgi:hypothetical protein